MKVSPACARVAPLFAGAVKKTGGKPRVCKGGNYVLKNEYGHDKPGRRRCFAAPGGCRHALAVYELAHNLMWLDVA